VVWLKTIGKTSISGFACFKKVLKLSLVPDGQQLLGDSTRTVMMKFAGSMASSSSGSKPARWKKRWIFQCPRRFNRRE
jgi:hypothetical protein